MREILFRGKRCDNGEWVNGSLLNPYRKKPLIAHYEDGQEILGYIVEVISETVGQYTGLRDKNGERIFEGDIVDVLYNPRYGGVAKQRIGIRKVVFEDGCFMMEDDEGYHLHFIVNEDITVVGNIYDNPELLEGEYNG